MHLQILRKSCSNKRLSQLPCSCQALFLITNPDLRWGLPSLLYRPGGPFIINMPVEFQTPKERDSSDKGHSNTQPCRMQKEEKPPIPTERHRLAQVSTYLICVCIQPQDTLCALCPCMHTMWCVHVCTALHMGFCESAWHPLKITLCSPAKLCRPLCAACHRVERESQTQAHH